MNGKWTLFGSILAVLLLALAVGLARAQGPQPPDGVSIQAALGTAFTYQGQLRKDGNPVNGICDLQFSLWDAAGSGSPPTGGNQIGSPQTKTGISVSNGYFTIPDLDFGAGAFQGDARWLQIAVKCAGDTSYTTLTPRQPLTPAPYALFSKAAPWSGLSGVPAGFADGVDNDTTYTAGAGLLLSGNQFSLDTGYTDGRYWKLGGNILSAEGSLGSQNNYALNFLVNNQRALRLEPNATSPNLIGGYSGNSVTGGVYGATIGGGGAGGVINSVTGNYGTVGGGGGNTAGDSYATVGGGWNNNASGEGAAIAGGSGNATNGSYPTVGGGLYNTAGGSYATVGGGGRNSAGGWYATVGGGYTNTAGGYAATVPGGRDNTAQGMYSFAAGRRAKASHDGAFVWADSTDADFASTANNQFAVRATGGVSFTTGSNTDFRVNGNTVWHAGNDGHNSGLDADTVDGLHEGQLARRAYNGIVPSNGSVTIEIPHYTPFTLHLASGWPDFGGVAFVQGFENDRNVAITYIAYNGDGTSSYGGAECHEGDTTTLLTFGSGALIYTVRCPGEADGPHNLVLTATGVVELRYTLIY